MTDIPKCTSWRGHKFEGRYSSQPDATLSAFQVQVFAKDMPLLVTKRTYERDICVRCGATVEKKP